MELDDNFFPIICRLVQLRDDLEAIDLEGNYFSDGIITDL
jgi:hypothetical protein